MTHPRTAIRAALLDRLRTVEGLKRVEVGPPPSDPRDRPCAGIVDLGETREGSDYGLTERIATFGVMLVASDADEADVTDALDALELALDAALDEPLDRPCEGIAVVGTSPELDPDGGLVSGVRRVTVQAVYRTR